MRCVTDIKPLKRYRRIDWGKPAPPIPGWKEPLALFTESEAQEKNRALRFNRTTYRWVPDDQIAK